VVCRLPHVCSALAVAGVIYQHLPVPLAENPHLELSLATPLNHSIPIFTLNLDLPPFPPIVSVVLVLRASSYHHWYSLGKLYRVQESKDSRGFAGRPTARNFIHLSVRLRYSRPQIDIISGELKAFRCHHSLLIQSIV